MANSKQRIYEVIEVSREGDASSRAYDILMNTTIFVGMIPLTLKADNLYTHSNYPGFTPETNSFGNNTVFQGFDYSSYPLSRRVIFGINVTF